MPVNCTYWRDVESPACGACSLGLFGGNPSHGVCTNCDKRDLIEPEPPRLRESITPPGIGDRLKRIVRDCYGVEPCPGCSTLAWALNDMTAAQARQHADEIVQRMIENAGNVQTRWRWLLPLPGGAALGRLEARKLLAQAIEEFETHEPENRSR